MRGGSGQPQPTPLDVASCHEPAAATASQDQVLLAWQSSAGLSSRVSLGTRIPERLRGELLHHVLSASASLPPWLQGAWGSRAAAEHLGREPAARHTREPVPTATRGPAATQGPAAAAPSQCQGLGWGRVAPGRSWDQRCSRLAHHLPRLHCH